MGEEKKEVSEVKETKETKEVKTEGKKSFLSENALEVITVILLGITALLTAWASYVGSIHGGIKHTQIVDIMIEVHIHPCHLVVQQEPTGLGQEKFAFFEQNGTDGERRLHQHFCAIK